MSAEVHLIVEPKGDPDMGRSKEELTELFQKEVDDFSEWMAGNPNWKQQGPLSRPEKVLLVTYLMQKYAGNIDAKTYGQEKK
jgi:hypothetical protein